MYILETSPHLSDVIESGSLMLAAKIDSSKSSLHYDIKDGHKKITTTVALSQNNNNSLADIKTNIGITLPIKQLEEFLELDSSLSTDKKRKEECVSFMVLISICEQINIYYNKVLYFIRFTLIFFFRQMTLAKALIFNAKTVSKAIDNILVESISRAVQLEYSAVRKATRGVAKKNFSQTELYDILNGIFLYLLFLMQYGKRK